MPDQEPFETVSVWLTCAVPLIAGGVVFEGATGQALVERETDACVEWLLAASYASTPSV